MLQLYRIPDLAMNFEETNVKKATKQNSCGFSLIPDSTINFEEINARKAKKNCCGFSLISKHFFSMSVCSIFFVKPIEQIKNRMDPSGHNSRLRKKKSEERVVRNCRYHKVLVPASIFEPDFVKVYSFNFIHRDFKQNLNKIRKDLSE